MKHFLCAWVILSSLLAGAEVLTLEPITPEQWAPGVALPESAELPLKPEARAGVCSLCLRVDALLVRLHRRAEAHEAWLELSGEAEEPTAERALRFALTWQGRRYTFDRWGAFVLDRRLILPEEEELLTRFDAFYRSCLAQTPYAKVPEAVPAERPKAGKDALPVFAGFEDERYQQYDALIQRIVAEFNASPASFLGAGAGQTPNIPALSPALVKALMIEESGGLGARSRAAWEVDPMQVNVPGDWVDAKLTVGLAKPEQRNTGSAEGNIRAGVAWLARKGFGTSGQPIANRPNAFFDSWRAALQRYNGRESETGDGRVFHEAYATRILRRATHPERFVPIAIEHRVERVHAR